ncbi:MAG TPA: cytochrome c oxidase subunit 3 [Saprospiraceae bacterium]|nr:cytochrome c oxidase subunit 3 [Saprospiraceae bacterium]
MRGKNIAIRPGAIVLTLVLMGISTLFAGLCAAYLYTLISTRVDAPRPPILFLLNIPVLLSATLVLKKSLSAFDNKSYRHMVKYQVFCLCLTLVFIILQILGWTQVFHEIPLTASQARSFLFVLSALHLLHVFAGIPFLFWCIWMNRGDINQLRYFFDHRRGYLQGLKRYWNYLDILWILLVMILSIGFALKWL